MANGRRLLDIISTTLLASLHCGRKGLFISSSNSSQGNNNNNNNNSISISISISSHNNYNSSGSSQRNSCGLRV